MKKSQRYYGTLRHPPAQLMRVSPQLLNRVRHRDSRQHIQCLFLRFRPTHADVSSIGIFQLSSYRQQRVQMRSGVLHDETYLAPPYSGPILVSQSQEVVAAEHRLPAAHSRALGQ
jgi:hypothetical protein